MKELWKRVKKKSVRTEAFQNVCPVCDHKPMWIEESEIEIPYVGKVLEVTSLCKQCGFKYVTLDYLEEKEPVRYIFKVESEDDLNTKVYRSKYGIIEIKELGLKVEPGVAAEGYLTNVEGVLNRFKEIVEQYIRFHKGERGFEKEIERALILLEKIEEVREGKMVVSLVLTDPAGISSIVSEKAKKEILSQEEAEQYRTSFVLSFE